MESFILALSGFEVLHLLKAEYAGAGGAPELKVTCEKDFIIEENFDHAHYGIRVDAWLDLVTSIATLTIEPRRESGYWILSVTVERALGLVQSLDTRDMTPTQLTLNEFEGELCSARLKEIAVRLDVETSDIRRDFDQWLADKRARYPWSPRAITALERRSPSRAGAVR
jgi:hypothetical protein